MHMTFRGSLFDEPTFMAVVDSPDNRWIRESYCRLEECLLPEPVFYRLPFIPWTGQVLIEPRLLKRSVQDDHRVGPITYLKELWRRLLASTLDLLQYLEPRPGDGVQLPLPQTMRRGNRMAHEPQSSSENGGDYD